MITERSVTKRPPTAGQRRCARRRGSVTLMAGAGMVAFMGFCALAIDYGVLVSDKNRLQRACDSAALAGASSLPNQEAAKDLAISAAALNAVTVERSGITFEQNDSIVRVGAIFSRSLWFARVIGIPNATVSAYAKASAASMVTPKVVPIGITQETYKAYKNDTLPHSLTLPRPVDTEYGKDDFLLFDLRLNSAKSPTQMYKQLIGGSFETVTIGSTQTSLNATDGAVMGKFTEALSIIFERSAQAPWADTWTGDLTTSLGIRYAEILAGTAPPGNPRIMHIIVNPDTGSPTGGGTWDVKIIDFAPVYLEGFARTTDPLTGETSTVLIVRFLPQGTVASGHALSLIE